MKDNLKEFSKKTKMEADEILADTKIIELLQQYGEVHIGGSYAYDLMYGPDIDIDVVSDSPRNSAIQAVNKIIDAKMVQKLEFGDFENFKRENRPEAYIIVLKVQKNDRKWGIEIWFKKEISPKLKQLTEQLNSLSEEGRLKVLELKAEDKMSSIDIYQHVLGFDKQKN